jgi:hypothetical protein
MEGRGEQEPQVAQVVVDAASDLIRRLEKKEVAPYVGPLVIEATRGRNGRGLFVTDDVKADTIVLVEKAVAVVAGSRDEEEEDGGEEGNELEDFFTEGVEALCHAVEARVEYDPVVNAWLLCLLSGIDDTEEDGKGGEEEVVGEEKAKREIPPMRLFETDAPDVQEEEDEKRGKATGGGEMKAWM